MFPLLWSGPLQAQLALAAHLRAAGALGPPYAPPAALAEAFRQQLAESGFPVGPSPPCTADAVPLGAAAASPTAQRSPPASSSSAQGSPPCSARTEAAWSAQVPPVPQHQQQLQPQPGLEPEGDDSTCYRLLLADLESSIDTWRAQLRWAEKRKAGGSPSGRRRTRRPQHAPGIWY